MPFLVATMVKTWVNAWCAQHRFQAARGLCRFGCGAARGDCIHHYVMCPILADWIRQLDSGGIAAGDIWALLGLANNLTERDILQRAVVIHCAMTTFEHIRSHNGISTPRETMNLLTGRLRNSRAQHRIILQAFNDEQWMMFLRNRRSNRRRRRSAT